MDVNEFCKAKSEEQTRILKQAACMSNTDLIQIRDTPELRKQIKELRKYTSELSIQAVCKEYALKTQEKNREMFRHQIVCKYIDGCVKLCWLMNAQDPPVVFATSVSPNSDFDSNIYRHYTKSGSKVQFMVWPALLLHEGGPILTKGVAQGHSVPKSTPGASVYEARSHTNAPDGQSASDGRTPLGTREAWGTSDKTKGPFMSDERNIPSVTARSNSENSTQYYDAPNATRGQTQGAQSKPGYSQQSAQPFPITEDGHYQSDANVGRDVTSQSNTRNTCYVDDPFDKLAEFNNQSSNTSSPMLTKISDQPTRRLNTFSSSVNVPISVDFPSYHDMQLFYSYMRYGEFSCRNMLGDARYNKCVNYYNNVVLPQMTHGYRT